MNEFTLLPSQVLKAVFFVTATGVCASTFTTKLPSQLGGIIGTPVTTHGPEVRGAVFTDSLSKRYGAEQLAPFDVSRRQMHMLMLGARTACDSWSEPAVNLGDDGQLELEWWRGGKSFTVAIDGSRMSYLKAWGADVNREMADGELHDLAEFLKHWRWLQE